MENKDKIYKQFKEAARKTEQQEFERIEAVWNRVEEKLDKKKKRRGIVWWKYTGAAAVILVFISIGNLIMRNDADPIIVPDVLPENNITVIDTQKVNKAFNTAAEEVNNEVIVTTEPQDKYAYDTLRNEKVINRELTWEQKNDAGAFRTTGKVNRKDSNPIANSAIPHIAYSEETDKVKPVLNNKNKNVNASISNMATISPNASNQYPAVTANKYPIHKDAKVVANKKYRDGDLAKDVETIEGRTNASMIQSLQGQVAGLKIATASGQPGADDTIILRGVGSIRGNVEPLFIIDGIPVDEDGFRSLNQNDIDSFTILKDAAATSIYGNRGANGVIVIKTKSGYFVDSDEYEVVKEDYENREDIIAKLTAITKLPGGNDPLYVVDGFIIDSESFKHLNIDDIADCKIIKDAASTSIYGNKGANGVVVVTTKKIRFAKKEKAENEYTEQTITPEKIQVDQEEYESFAENPFENPLVKPLSTFSVDVDNASYTNIRRFLNNGQTVPKDAVRVEEMVNFFDYIYTQPEKNEVFGIGKEYSTAPWNTRHKLLKINLQAKNISTLDLPASNLIFLIDVSGSMNNSNKLPLLKQSMKLIVNQMRAKDRIAIVVYAGAAGLVLPSTSGAEKNKIIAALNNLDAGGSTAGGAGIELAYKTAQEHFIKDGNNRIILATDGDFNVGASSDSDMQTLIEEKRKSGVFLTCLGYGMGNYKDSKMEILADKGNGNYAYIDTMQEADRFLQKEFKGSMYAVAKDVKFQIEFNPAYVQSYRLIGYENRLLRDEDFANDAIDAGEVGSGHTVTVLYEIIPTGVNSQYFNSVPKLKYSQLNSVTNSNNNELATIKYRYKKPDGDTSIEKQFVIKNAEVEIQNTSADFKFAAAVAWFGLKLRDSKLIPNKESEAIIKLASEGLMHELEYQKQGQMHDHIRYRAEFIRLVKMVE